MARPLRIEFVGALYHITSRGNERKPIYLNDSDFVRFLEVISEVCERFHWVIHAYCLMTNHYHLLVETPEANLSQGMRQLNGVYTQTFNRAHQRVGHLFQGRYKAIVVDKEAYLLELSRYIVLNPIRAGMVDTLEAWPWSSWPCAMGLTASPDWLATDALLRGFSKYRKTAQMKYAEFVQQGRGIDPWQQVTNGLFLGRDVFVAEQLARLKEGEGDLSEVPKKQRRACSLSLKAHEDAAESRDQAIVAAYASGNFTLKAIGDHFGLHYSRVSRIVAKVRE